MKWWLVLGLFVGLVGCGSPDVQVVKEGILINTVKTTRNWGKSGDYHLEFLGGDSCKVYLQNPPEDWPIQKYVKVVYEGVGNYYIVEVPDKQVLENERAIQAYKVQE